MTTQMTLYYFIDIGKGSYGQFKVEITTTIRDILDKIYTREDLRGRSGCAPSDFQLYAPPNLTVDAEEIRLRRVKSEGLPLLTLQQTVEQAFELKEVEGGLNDRLLVVVPQPTAEIRRGRGKTQELVDDFLREQDTRLKGYVAGLPWNDFWTVPTTPDSETASFINNLNIPRVSSAPALLLHNLGKDIVDQSVLDTLFSGGSQLLVNTSGSGKTRLLFEGLTQNWGFYFTTVVKLSSHGFGSTDIMEAINEYIPNSRSFNVQPEKSDCVWRAYKTNHDIVDRHVRQVLLARILVFERFLTMAEVFCSTREINEFKMHWLFLQLRPVDILGGDVFATVSDILKDADDEYLEAMDFELNYKIFQMQRKFNLNKSFFFILDDAQMAIEQLHGCFRSLDASAKRPVLTPIINTWMHSLYFPIIVSGTSLSINVVNDTRRPLIGLSAPFLRATNTGAFDDRQRQRKYIMRYMPGHIAASESGKEFLERAWQYVHGRHRFTAAMLEELIKTSFMAPHKVLDRYVSTDSNFTPTGGRRFFEKEVEVDMDNVLPMNFTKITQDPELKRLFSDIVFTWLLTQRPITVDKKYKDLVQLGFARLVESQPSKAILDEPLVLLAAAHALSTQRGFTLQDHIISPMRLTDSPGLHFERLVAHYLASAFDGERELHEIFDFRENIPQWAKQPAEVVSVTRFLSGGLRLEPFYLPEELDSTTRIGFKSGGMEETVDWFEKPSSLLCFPDPHMGPEIVLFVRLKDSKKVLTIVVQCKWQYMKSLPKAVAIEAGKSLDASNFFGDSTSRTPNAEKASTIVLNMFKRLNYSRPESDNWFKHGVPMLKVIASYPAVAQDLIPADCTTLNMDPYVYLLDTAGTMKAMAEKLTRGKRPTPPDDGST